MNGQRSALDENGNKVSAPLEASNLRTFETVIHENIHGWEHQIADGTIPCQDPSLAVQYQVNDFIDTAVLQDGYYRMGTQYVKGVTPGGYYFYFVQATERDAQKGAEAKTAALVGSLSERFGTEKSFEAYSKDIAENGYQATLREAMQIYQNPNFEQDVNQVILNQHLGTTTAVEPNTERGMKAEMTATYQFLQESLTNTEENTPGGQGLGNGYGSSIGIASGGLESGSAGSDLGDDSGSLDDGLDGDDLGDDLDP